MAQMTQGLAAWRATAAKVLRLYGLALLAEALAVADDTGEHRWDAERYRLKGEVLLARATEQHTEAETCFRQALDIARCRQAKSWELRAAMRLSRCDSARASVPKSASCWPRSRAVAQFIGVCSGVEA
jgi:hypothetical protein